MLSPTTRSSLPGRRRRRRYHRCHRCSRRQPCLRQCLHRPRHRLAQPPPRHPRPRHPLRLPMRSVLVVQRTKGTIHACLCACASRSAAMPTIARSPARRWDGTTPAPPSTTTETRAVRITPSSSPTPRRLAWRRAGRALSQTARARAFRREQVGRAILKLTAHPHPHHRPRHRPRHHRPRPRPRHHRPRHLRHRHLRPHYLSCTLGQCAASSMSPAMQTTCL